MEFGILEIKNKVVLRDKELSVVGAKVD